MRTLKLKIIVFHPHVDRLADAAAPTIEIDDICGKMELIAAGGVGRLPLFMGDNDPRLERASPVLPDAGWKLWLISHQAFKSSRRIKTITDALSRYFAGNKKI